MEDKSVSFLNTFMYSITLSLPVSNLIETECEVSRVSRIGICAGKSRKGAKLKRWYLCQWSKFRVPWSMCWEAHTHHFKPVWAGIMRALCVPGPVFRVPPQIVFLILFKGHGWWDQTIFLPVFSADFYLLAEQCMSVRYMICKVVTPKSIGPFSFIRFTWYLCLSNTCYWLNVKKKKNAR